MRVCVPLRDPAVKNLHSGNMRSEPRCERLMLEALSEFDWVTDIYTYRYEWKDSSKITDKYRGVITKDKEKDTVLLMQDWGWLDSGHEYMAYVVNLFAVNPTPSPEDIRDINSCCDRVGDRFVFTCGYPSLLKIHKVKRESVFARPKQLLLPYPNIPDSRFANRFDNSILLFPQRIMLVENLYLNPCVIWALNRLLSDDSLRLVILTGAEKGSVADKNGGVVFKIQTEINDYFWSRNEVKKFIRARERVELHYGVDWSDVLDVYKETKLLAQADRHYGGPSLEAAMHGIPFVGTMKDQGALCECPAYLFRNEDSVFDTLDRLMDDRGFYESTAKAYHDYAMSLYSFEAYGKNLYNILNNMGLY